MEANTFQTRHDFVMHEGKWQKIQSYIISDTKIKYHSRVYHSVCVQWGLCAELLPLSLHQTFKAEGLLIHFWKDLESMYMMCVHHNLHMHDKQDYI